MLYVNRVWRGQRGWILIVVSVLVAALALAFTPRADAAPVEAPVAANRCGQVVVVAPGDTLTRIAVQCGVTVAEIVAVNPGLNPNRIYPSQVIQMPPPPTTVYIVQWGDRLASIARRFGVSIDDILALNPGISNPNWIYPGQRLLVPVADGSTGDWQSYRSPSYGYRVSLPSGWYPMREFKAQMGAARNVESITLYPEGAPNAPDRINLKASVNSPAMGAQACDERVWVDGVLACRAVLPGPTLSDQIVTFEKNGVYYYLAVTYRDEYTLRYFNQMLGTFETTGK